jgi:hypothetical protein
MSTWHKRDRTIRFLILGDAIDPEYSAVVRATVAALEGVFLVPAVEQQQFWGLLYVPAICTISPCLLSLTPSFSRIHFLFSRPFAPACHPLSLARAVPFSPPSSFVLMGIVLLSFGSSLRLWLHVLPVSSEHI